MNTNEPNSYDTYKLVSDKVRKVLDENGYETIGHRVTFFGDDIAVEFMRGGLCLQRFLNDNEPAVPFLLGMAQAFEEKELEDAKEKAEKEAEEAAEQAHLKKKIDDLVAFHGAEVEVLNHAGKAVIALSEDLVGQGLNAGQRAHLQDIKLMLDVCKAMEQGCDRTAEALQRLKHAQQKKKR